MTVLTRSAALVVSPAVVAAVDLEEVEDDQRHGVDLGQLLGTAYVTHVHAVGDRCEPRHTVEQRDDLPVQQHVEAGAGQLLQLGVGGADVVLVARPQLYGAPGDPGEDADPVPLDLVQPLTAARDMGALGGEHRAHGLHPG